MNLREALKTHFGYEAFRPYQEEIITQVLAGQDTLGVLTTGAGKSLTYQLPSLLLPRPTLVISPLIALMQDQLDGLPPSLYPHTTLINSTLELEELTERLRGIENGTYKLIYAAPERLRQQSFLRLLQRVGLSMVVVDEAHCVSVWGHDFRPDYMFIRRAIETLKESGNTPTLLALTATATLEMQAEIAEQLGSTLQTINAPMFRPNLKMEVFRCKNADAKMLRLAEICKETPGATIVYANSRERCEKLAGFLRGQGFPAAFYHAGLDRETRKETQERFMLGRVRIMVATVAFGMGVDKSNVRLVVHFTLPESLEAYTQEAGRAGRDGKPSRCTLLVAPSDKTNLNRWLRQSDVTLEMVRDTYRALKTRIGSGTSLINVDEILPSIFGADALEYGADTRLRVAISLLERVGLVVRHTDTNRDLRIELLPTPPNARANTEEILYLRKRHSQERLDEMVAYVEGTTCRHTLIARRFGQKQSPCKTACDLCLGTAKSITLEKVAAPSNKEVADVGRVLLECLRSIPFPVGRTALAKVALGTPDCCVSPKQCAERGTLEGFTRKAVIGFLDTLVEQNYLKSDTTGDYPRLLFTEKGTAALQSKETLLPNPNSIPTSGTRTRTQSTLLADPPLTGDEDDCFEQLRAWRRIEAEHAKVPPYVIFHDATLRAIARANPTTLAALSTVSGIGSRKIERYGATLLELLHPPPTAQ